MARFTDPGFFAKNPSFEYVFILSAMAGQLLVQSVSANVLPITRIIETHFGTSEYDSSWFMASAGLGIGTIILPSGSIGDKYGLKNAIVGGYIWAIIWSLLCGLSYYVQYEFFIVCRTFQGCGLAFVLPNIMGAIGRVYTPKTRRKNMVFSVVALCAPIGGVLGPLFAGLIGTMTLRWDWAYYSFAIALLLALLLTIIAIPDIPKNENNHVDWLGGFLGVAVLTLLNFVWNQAPGAGWSNPYIIVLLIVSILLIPLFICYELMWARHPMIPREVLLNSRLMLVLACVLIGWGTFGVKMFSIVSFLRDFRNYTPLAQGAAFVPSIPLGAIAALSCGTLLSLNIPVSWLLFFSMLGFVGSDIILATAPVHEVYWRSFLGLWFLAVLGVDWSFPASTILMSDTLPSNLQGLAGSLVSTAVNYGISLWLGIGANVYYQLEDSGLTRLQSWRGEMYFSVGSSGLCVIISLALLVQFYLERRKHHAPETVEKECIGIEKEIA